MLKLQNKIHALKIGKQKRTALGTLLKVRIKD